MQMIVSLFNSSFFLWYWKNANSVITTIILFFDLSIKKLERQAKTDEEEGEKKRRNVDLFSYK